MIASQILHSGFRKLIVIIEKLDETEPTFVILSLIFLSLFILLLRKKNISYVFLALYLLVLISYFFLLIFLTYFLTYILLFKPILFLSFLLVFPISLGTFSSSACTSPGLVVYLSVNATRLTSCKYSYLSLMIISDLVLLRTHVCNNC